jgi:acyl carrier protein
MTTSERVIKVLVDVLGVEAEEITDKSSIVDDLGADDLDLINLQMELEGEFNLEIPDEEYDNLDTFGKVVDYIKRETGAAE